MHDYLIAVIMGIVEGLTEFIPVSSTGHLIFTGNILGFTGTKANAFEIIIQLGAILAVVFLYWDKFVFMLRPRPFINRLKGLTDKSIKEEDRGLTLVEIIAGMIPAVIFGFLLNDLIDKHLFNSFTVAIGLILGGILLVVIEKVKIVPAVSRVEDITIKQAFLIGLMQCLSLWPGFSRSGATISGGMFTRLDRKTSAEFSFILAVPIMLAATTLKMKEVLTIFTLNDIFQLIIGFVVSFIVAYFAIVYFMKLLQKVSFIPFAIYRFIIGALAIIILVL